MNDLGRAAKLLSSTQELLNSDRNRLFYTAIYRLNGFNLDNELLLTQTLFIKSVSISV